MDILQKLEILSDAAKYDVACTSSGVDRAGKRGQLGASSQAGCCHSFTEDGRCISLLKVLMTNVCVYDCAYCVNRCSNADVVRTSFTPQELADLTIGLYRRNCIEGLFLSSGVIGDADRTTELMISCLRILREDYGFRGYIHAKTVPNTSLELVERLGLLADRLSVNVELPSEKSLRLLCPDKTRSSVLSPMRRISESIAEDAESRALVRKRKTVYLSDSRPKRAARAFAPAGQSTQMIIGATSETDCQILSLAASLYGKMQLKRVFFSAYLPIVQDARLPSSDHIQLDREHRLYQADWLMRFYGFSVSEIVDEAHPNLAWDLDPKAAWALDHLDEFPVEVNTCSYEMLLRVPGIGVRGAKLIQRARRRSTLGEQEVRKLGVAFRRARYFITCNGRYMGQGVEYTREAIRPLIASRIDGGQHGRRAGKVFPGQLSLFDEPSLAHDPVRLSTGMPRLSSPEAVQ